MSIRSGIITMTTDFGTADAFAGVMKGVILGIFPGARIVDLTHQIAPQDVSAAAWLLLDSVDFFPAGTVHLAVVDPGVGSERRAIAVKSKERLFVGPDNGVFSAFYPADLVISLNRPELFLPKVSATFHGRDVFAPVAARIAAGAPLADVGEPITDPVTIKMPVPSREGDKVIGEVIAVDRFGNLVTNVPGSMVPEGAEVVVHLCNTEISGLSVCYSGAEDDSLIALVGSHGRIEISLPGGSAEKFLSARREDEVEISFK